MAHADVVYDKTVANNGHYNDETNCQALNRLIQEVNFCTYCFLIICCDAIRTVAEAIIFKQVKVTVIHFLERSTAPEAYWWCLLFQGLFKAKVLLLHFSWYRESTVHTTASLFDTCKAKKPNEYSELCDFTFTDLPFWKKNSNVFLESLDDVEASFSL